MEVSIAMADNFTQKEMIQVVMADIEKIFEKLDQIQKDLATRPTRQEIYGWIIAGISIATLITILM
jgi:2'-5' RNA ligase|tara:strand:+ start:267 stop:464 length:198 start_codon:yes stop_codon:yes gene_type:complete